MACTLESQNHFVRRPIGARSSVGGKLDFIKMAKVGLTGNLGIEVVRYNDQNKLVVDDSAAKPVAASKIVSKDSTPISSCLLPPPLDSRSSFNVDSITVEYEDSTVNGTSMSLLGSARNLLLQLLSFLDLAY